MSDAISASPTPASNSTQVNSPARVLIASLVGTTIEFFDFYVYATAAVLVFPHLFFPASDSNAATLQSLVTFSIAFSPAPSAPSFSVISATASAARRRSSPH